MFKSTSPCLNTWTIIKRTFERSTAWSYLTYLCDSFTPSGYGCWLDMHMSCPRSLLNATKDLTIPPNNLFPANTICNQVCACAFRLAYTFVQRSSPETVRQIKNRISAPVQRLRGGPPPHQLSKELASQKPLIPPPTQLQALPSVPARKRWPLFHLSTNSPRVAWLV